MNEYFSYVRGNEKLRELRKEGMTGQELHRLGRSVPSVRSLFTRRSATVALTLGTLLILAVLATPVFAAPVASQPPAQPCANQSSSYPLGVDGGLEAIRMGWINVSSAPASYAQGVDGGLTGERFARDDRALSVASAGASCTAAFNPLGT
jgi:hypothetical protein